jgi:hypothetical protein
MMASRISQIKNTLSTRHAKKAAVGAVIFLVVFSLTGFFVVPPILKNVLIDKLSSGLHRGVSIRQVKVNPFMLSATIRGALIKEPNGQDRFISFDELYVNLQLMSIIKRGIVLSEVKLVGPHVTIIRNKDGTYNFSDLLESKPKAGGETPRFSLNNIQVSRGSIDFLDRLKDTKNTVTDLNIGIPFLSDLPHYVDIYTQPSFEARVNGTPVSLKGKTKPFKDSRETTFEIKFSGIDIPFYLAYSPVAIPFKMRSGLLDTDAVVTYTQYTNKAPVLSLAGNVVFRDIDIAERGGAPLLSFPAFTIVFAPSDMIAKKIHLASVALRSPRLNVARDKSGRINLQDLLPKNGPEGKKPVDKEKTSLSFDADRIGLSDGRIGFSDSPGASDFKTAIQHINLGIDNVSTAEGKKAHATLSFETEAKETVKAESDLSINPLVAEGTATVASVQLKKYAPYYSSRILFAVEDGRLDLSTRYRIEKTEEGPHIAISALSAVLSTLKLKKRGERDDFLNIPSAEVKDLSADTLKKELIVRELSTRGGSVRMRRDKGGSINLQGLLATPPPSPRGAEKGGKEKAAVKKEWLIKILDLAADGYSMRMEDLGQQESAHLAAERIKVRCSDLSTARNSKGKASLSFVFNRKGSVATSGSVSINPPAANMKVRVKGIELASFQPYFADRLNITVTGGSISLTGAVSAGYASNGAVKASFKGEAALAGFASVDAANGDDFLKWDALNLEGVRAGYAPLHLSIDKVALTDFYSRLIINKDGSLNLQGILREQGNKANRPSQTGSGQPVTGTTDKVSATASAGIPPPRSRSSAGAGKAAAVPHAQKPGKLITIETVTLQGGTINFTDRHIEPNYTANLLEIGGRVSGLSSEENKFADVDLKGKLENYAPLEITGRINPLRDDLFVDLKADFKDMDLGPVSPYSGRYAGYAIQKGRLSLSMKYLIVKRKLDAQNNILLDQFTFGDKVESPDATKLPVKLAIALLKNRKGEINLDIPVSGNIDDPKFSLGRIIIKIIVNLLVKAATSPFKLLGALFGHGEELSYVQFDYGHDDLSQPEIKKLDALVKALFDRPALKLEIEGHVDREKDKEGLRQYLFNKKIKAQKLKDMAKKGEPPVPVDEIQVGKEEYAKYLKMAYKAEKFPKPRNFLGIAKDLPAPEMEKLMLTNLKVGDDDLRLLASQRALRVKEYVIKSGQVTPDRVFLIEPKSLEPEKKEKLRDSRVDFRLK